MSYDGKVLIIGAQGRMGAALARRYASTREIISWGRSDLNLLHLDRVREQVENTDFSVLIYAAGLTNVDYCEDHEEEAFCTNSEVPGILAGICEKKGARLIHISTDYVFDGRNNTPLTEEAPTHPLSVYGRSKLAGEQTVLTVSGRHLVIRVSWLFGPDRPSFPDMILKRAMTSDHVEAISDKISCPTYSEDFAEWIEPMLDDNRYSGLLHLCNSGSTSWQNYGQTTLDIAARLGVPLKATNVEGLSRINFPSFKAERPEFTSFDTGKYQHLSGKTPRAWEDALEAYLKKAVSTGLCAV
ncbi:dTDP-4-dehydrorhamnose reductase [soil metagenome]